MNDNLDPNRPKEFGGVFAELGEQLRSQKKHWWLFLLLGIVLVLGGVLAIAYPFVSSVGAVVLLGVILLVCGVLTILGAFWAGEWSALLLQLLVGILYVVAGIAIRDAPVESAAVLTLFVAAFFIVVGAFRIVAALVVRYPQWGWGLVNGVVTLLGGIIIYDTFPSSALWVIGLLVGLDLLFSGWTWIMLAMVVRRLPERSAAPLT